MVRENQVTPETIGRETKAAEILDYVVRLGLDSRREQEKEGGSWVNDRLKDLPTPARERIRQRDRRLVELGLSESQRAEILKDDIEGVETTYVDQRFVFEGGQKILKDQFGKELVREWTDEILENVELRMEDLDRVARLSFDANGLKAINDLSTSHERGDEFLKRIAEVIRNEDCEAYRLLREAGASEVIPLTGGGDEYTILVRGDRPLDIEGLRQAVRSYEAAVAAVDCGDLVDFGDLGVKLRFLGVSPEEYGKMDETARLEMETRFREDIPEGFRMPASMSGGVETLQQGLMLAINDPRDKKRLKPDEQDYDAALSKIMGGLWDASDREMMAVKKGFKARLESAETSPEERALSRIFSRNKAEREARRRIEELERKARSADVLTGEMARLTAMREELGDGAFAEAVVSLMSRF
ncbi:hypothetical protein JW899_01860 [Candidatus Uhrbacteria bacterium]|nr:hypothetical protein [Candidatus Uhrbacteria bacterium]